MVRVLAVLFARVASWNEQAAFIVATALLAVTVALYRHNVRHR